MLIGHLGKYNFFFSNSTFHNISIDTKFFRVPLKSVKKDVFFLLT